MTSSKGCIFLIKLAQNRIFNTSKYSRRYMLRSQCLNGQKHYHIFSSSTKSNYKHPNFGLLFDIDGVIVRGHNVLPPAVEAFKGLIDPTTGKFQIPTVFLTNAGNKMRHQKAQQLSNWLGVQISEDQVVMSHSPLRMFTSFHHKHCLISGQGPIEDIAKGVGFTKTATVDQLSRSFPLLDAVDQAKRNSKPCSFEQHFPKIEALVLLGEPVRWETSLQLILDVLMTNGHPSKPLPSVPYPHIPILACNMDLQWMAEACLPRFGHGAFLLCLENLYKKITGKDIIYTALVGKPSEITFRHAEYCIQQQARELKFPHPIKRLYAIGDNINTDIYGANLYHRYVQKRNTLHKKEKIVAQAAAAGASNSSRTSVVDATDSILGIKEGATSCESVLVQTGVYNENNEEDSDHSPRDFLPAEAGMKNPTYVVQNVLNALEIIFHKEGFL